MNHRKLNIENRPFKTPQKMSVLKTIQQELYIHLKGIFILARITNIYSDKMSIAFANIRV
nr:hypothetical protein [uncultured Flavobacterium sp.]